MRNESIQIQNLTKIFPGQDKPALDKINASISRGKITGIVGPDGAGKTTLLRLMAAILLPSEGQIIMDGDDTATHPDKVHNKIGYMPQQFGLYEDLTVLENLTLYADIRDLPLDERSQTFDSLLHFTGLNRFQSRLAGRLSGGMKQKLGLACALLRQPDILLMDEPSVGVDPISRRELWKIVTSLVKDGTTVLWSTSYLDEAESCSEVLLLNEGQLIFDGPPQKLMKKVDGRIFETKSKLTDRRGTLLKLIKNERLLDGIIKGDSLRIVLNKESTVKDISTPGLDWHKVDPNFEDGFIDALGGINERDSPIAKHIKNFELGSESIIQANGLTKKFGDFTAVSDVSFDVKPGEIFGLLGPNGAGKSTTFKMMCGLLKPTAGSSVVMGHHLGEGKPAAFQNIGYMAQKFSLFGNLTVLQNLNFFAGTYLLSGKKKTTAIQEMIHIFNFEKHLDESAQTLPLGYKQRLALACSLMHQPPVLFLDEPTSGVDPLTRREFWMHINGMVKKGITVMVTTHFMDEAEYCDRICLIFNGKIIALGTPDELKGKAKFTDHTPTLEEAFITLIESSQNVEEKSFAS